MLDLPNWHIDETAWLADRASGLLDAGRAGAAGIILDILDRASPDDPRSLALRTRAALAGGDIERAVELLDRAIVADPGPALSWRSRGACLLALNRTREAATDAAEAVVRAPDDAASLSLLGRALLSLGRASEARVCLNASWARAADGTGSIDLRRADPATVVALAQALSTTGDSASAEALLDAATAALPLTPWPRRARAVLHVRDGRFAEALKIIAQARADGVIDACMLGVEGHALTCVGDHATAGRVYAEAFAMSPDDPYVRHLAAAAAATAGASPGVDRADPDYVRAVFDGYAHRFDSHLISLEYRVPGLIRAALGSRLQTLACRPWLDLGCGTGLMAVVLSDTGLGSVTGVDLSSAMLAGARQKALYESLVEAEIVEWLGRTDARWPLIVAADCACYFGELFPLLNGIAGRLTNDGIAIFSVEALADHVTAPRGWTLGRGGRFAHSAEAVRTGIAAAGLRLEWMTSAPLRNEGGAPVAGLLVMVGPVV